MVGLSRHATEPHVAPSAIKAMFESNLQEGMKLQFDPSPARPISLDDDGAALTTIWQVVHFRAHGAPLNLTIDDIVRIDIVGDKHDFIEAM
ncbi:hypothetical protein LTR95_001028 [Oleoguttula sp. CCFEE 5521]